MVHKDNIHQDDLAKACTVLSDEMRLADDVIFELVT